MYYYYMEYSHHDDQRCMLKRKVRFKKKTGITTVSGCLLSFSVGLVRNGGMKLGSSVFRYQLVYVSATTPMEGLNLPVWNSSFI